MDEIKDIPELGKENFAAVRDAEDKTLEPLLDEVESITDMSIRSFVRAILVNAPEWYWTAPASLEDDVTLPDELEEGGLVLHIRRSIKAFELLAMTAGLSREDTDLGMAALLVTHIERYKKTGDDLEYNLWYAFSAPKRIDKLIEFDRLWGQDGLSNTIAIGSERIEIIKRLLRVQDGRWTEIPEVRPQTVVELVYHQALYVASCLSSLVKIDEI